MTRRRWFGASAAVLALTLAACGSDAPAQSDDDFIDAMDDICRDATRDLERLDPEDSNYLDDVLDIIQTGIDDLDELTPPKDFEDDFNDFVANLEDQHAKGEDLRDALDDDDQEKAADIAADLDDLNKESNELAESIGADRCQDVNGGGGEGPGDTTPDTTPGTTPATDAPTVNTPLPIDTTPITEPVITDPPTPTETGAALDASANFFVPAGYEWGTLDDLAGTPTPSDDPVLGPLLSGYYAGLLTSTTGGNDALIYITVLNQDTPWTQEQLDAYYAFELVSGGTDTTTPTLGLSARVMPEAIEGLDGAAFTIPGFGVSVLGPSGADLLGLLDAFAQAQTE